MDRSANKPLLFLMLLALGATSLVAAETTPRAEWHVTGLGWFGNRKAQQNLRLLGDGSSRATLDANAIEDASLLLFSSLNEEGYLAPSITAELTLADGRTASYPLDAQLNQPLPRPLDATAVTMRVERGRLYYLGGIRFEGLKAVSEADARAFFVGEGALISLAGERIYSPSRLRRSVADLRAELWQRGYANATVEAANLAVDPESGAARVRIVVREGPLWLVTSFAYDISDGSAVPAVTPPVGRPWSGSWRQDATQSIRRRYYEHGYPDVQVKLTSTDAPGLEGQRHVSVTAHVTPGPEVHLSGVRFTGNTHTKEELLRRRVAANPGDLLDRTKLDDGMSRLARLGVFNNIALSYEPPDGAERDAVYQVAEGRRQEVNLLAGYGSYEKLRGGVEWRQFNLWGRAHSSDLRLVQSMKSTTANYTYTVPEIFGEAADGSAQLFGLRREELAFLREEYGATLSLLWPLRGIGASLTTGYTYQNLNNDDNQLATHTTDEGNTKSASIDVGFVKDKRDNPLTPHRGYKFYARTNWASKRFGGETDYQQNTLGISWHHPIGRGRWVHVGLAHAVVTTWGAPEGSEPPVNVLLYPGGDDSIRGYSKGEAAPRAASGEFIGAKTATQLNLEFEQALTNKWTGILFFDALGTAARLEDYPWSEELYSVGVGVRYQTIVGPIRLEYGYNLNRRPLDPTGTLLFSVGFPF